jgi:hypothetical protein
MIPIKDVKGKEVTVGAECFGNLFGSNYLFTVTGISYESPSEDTDWGWIAKLTVEYKNSYSNDTHVGTVLCWEVYDGELEAYLKHARNNSIIVL